MKYRLGYRRGDVALSIVFRRTVLEDQSVFIMYSLKNRRRESESVEKKLMIKLYESCTRTYHDE